MVHKNTRMLDDVPSQTGDDIASERKLLHSHILTGEPVTCVVSGQPEGMPSDPKGLLEKLLGAVEALVERLRERAAHELQTLADAPIAESGGSSPVDGTPTPNSELYSPTAGAGEEVPGGGSCATADFSRLTDGLMSADAIAAELVGAGVPYAVNTAGKGTMWSDADTRAEGMAKHQKRKEKEEEDGMVQEPYGGESHAMMHMRWDRLVRQLRNKEKGKWDLSKVPDVLDSVKYDSIHNSHLNLPELGDILSYSLRLGRGIIANEYGLASDTRLRIGATLMSPLLAKLVQDLNKACHPPDAPKYGKHSAGNFPTPTSSMGGERNVVTVEKAVARALEAHRGKYSSRDSVTKESSSSFRDGPQLPKGIVLNPNDDSETPNRASQHSPTGLSDGRDSQLLKRHAGGDGDGEVTVRLDPSAAGASGVRSGTRNVVTRVYFTSESHIYGLMNVLRCANDLAPAPDTSQMVTDNAEQFLANSAKGYDYLSHLVIRVFEKPNAETEEDFRVEFDFSLGATESMPSPDDKKPPPLARRVRLSSSRLHLARVKELLDACTRSPPVVPGAWEDKDGSDADAKEGGGFSVGVHGMKQHNSYPARTPK